MRFLGIKQQQTSRNSSNDIALLFQKRNENRNNTLNYDYNEEYITKETQKELLFFEIELAKVLLKCKDAKTIEKIVEHRTYLVREMHLSLATSARSTLALYFNKEYQRIIRNQNV